MRFRGWTAALLMLCASIPLAAAQSGSDENGHYVPQLGEIMNTVQTRHLKLYFAGKAQNWDLADFELRQLRASLVEAAVLYAGIPVSNVTTMAEPLQSLTDAIKAKDGRKFAAAMTGLTEGCNACHRSMNRGFIVLREPTEQPFSNQVFAPQKK